MLFLKNRAA